MFTNPANIPALVAGGFWLPGERISYAAGNTYWGSGGQEANDFSDAHTGHKPVLTNAGNGARVWDYPMGGDFSSFIIQAPSLAMRGTQKVSIAGWFKANSLDELSRYFFLQWPGSGTNCRFFFVKNGESSGLYRTFVNLSYNGSASDAGPIGSRAKWNSAAGPLLGPMHDWTRWTFVRLTIDMSLANYQIGGANFSHRLKVYVDHELIGPEAGDGSGQYSAPQTGVGGEPPDGPMRGIFASTAPFCLGADHVSSHWNGQIGPIYYANGDEGLNDTVWRRIAEWKRPASY